MTIIIIATIMIHEHCYHDPPRRHNDDNDDCNDASVVCFSMIRMIMIRKKRIMIMIIIWKIIPITIKIIIIRIITLVLTIIIRMMIKKNNNDYDKWKIRMMIGLAVAYYFAFPIFVKGYSSRDFLYAVAVASHRFCPINSCQDSASVHAWTSCKHIVLAGGQVENGGPCGDGRVSFRFLKGKSAQKALKAKRT